MSQAKAVKHLVIELEYIEMSDFDEAISAIRKRIKVGVQESKDVKDKLRFEYGLCFLQEFDCRIENINNQECIVIPSKMNKK
ncbi:MAG: hypothetical protein ACJASM_002042 [Salibacteraceae bacterium]|jgi:hypothetical protein